ncbi:MAG: DUF2339 domain-containing protein [Oscillospiraceae bacterium]|jgi:uncharacterized membrane protein|nr:DUF2339 domain-containing protein [Oscillospiraceae bacterium]
MEKTDSILALLNQQQALITRLEGEITTLAATDTVAENRQLQQNLTEVSASFASLKQEHEQAETELKELRATLKRQLYHEKFMRIRQAERRTDALFEKELGTQMNRLETFELGAKRRIAEIAEKITRTEFGAENDLRKKLQELDGLVNERIDEIRRLEAENTSLFHSIKRDELSALYNTKITEAQAQKAVRAKNIESLIGLNIINKIGILLLILGTIAAGRFAYVKLPDTFKTLLIFLVGLALAGLGEGIRKKTSAVFSQGLISGGVAIVYVGLVTGYMAYDLFSVTVAFLLCILITALAFFLSLRHRSQTISVFALVGGFLPLLAILMFEQAASTVNFQNYTVIAVYLAILSLFTLVLSFFKRWDVTRITSAVLNLAASFAYLYYIGVAIARGWLSLQSHSAIYQLGAFVLTLFALSFLIALAIPLLSALRNHLGFRRLDVAYIAFAGAGFSLLLCVATGVFFGDLRYALSVTLAGELAVFAVLAAAIKKHLRTEKTALGLLFSYAFVLAMLVPALSLQERHLLFAWAAEMAAIFVYGTLKNKKFAETAGWAALGASLVHLVFIDLSAWRNTRTGTGEFLLQYGILTLCILSVLGTLAFKNTAKTTWRHQTFACFAVAFTWLFAHVALNYAWVLVEAYPFLILTEAETLIAKSIALFTAVFIPVAALHSRRVFSTPLAYTATALYTVSFIMANAQNIVFDPQKAVGTPQLLAAMLLPALANLAAVTGVLDATRALLLVHRQSKELLPLPGAVAFVVLLTELMLFYGLRFINPAISIAYLAFALALITFGFLRRFTFIRHFGLGLTLVSLAKLFLLDFSGAKQQWRILSYFAFGILFIAISFTYQFFSKRSENTATLMADADDSPPPHAYSN